MARSQRCSQCQQEGHNILTCGVVEGNTKVERGKTMKIPTISPLQKHSPTGGEVFNGTNFSEMETMIEKLRTAKTSTSAGNVAHVKLRTPSEGYSNVNIPKGSEISKDENLVNFIKSSALPIQKLGDGDVRSYVSPKEYWENRKKRNPSPGYESLKSGREERLNLPTTPQA